MLDRLRLLERVARAGADSVAILPDGVDPLSDWLRVGPSAPTR